MPPHIIMHGIPIAIIASIAVQRSAMASIADASMGIILQIMPSFAISTVMRQDIGGIIMPGIGIAMGMVGCGIIPIGIPPIMGIPAMGIPPIIGIGIGIIMGIIGGIVPIGIPPINGIGIPPIIGIGIPPIIGIGSPPIMGMGIGIIMGIIAGIAPAGAGVVPPAVIGTFIGVIALSFGSALANTDQRIRLVPARSNGMSGVHGAFLHRIGQSDASFADLVPAGVVR